MKEVLGKVKRLEIKLRRMVTANFAGEYSSAFKGAGLEFEEVRAYQYGDDVRFIDWNVSAKTGVPHVKIFKEERELQLFALADVSASERFAASGRSKMEIVVELVGLFGFLTLQNNDKFGMMAYSDQVELFQKPGKGKRHVLSCLNSIYKLEPQSRGTDLRGALEQFMAVAKRRTVLFVISDFLDEDYADTLKLLRGKHDVVLIRLYHPAEALQSFTGAAPVQNLESQRISWLFNASRSGTRAAGRDFEGLTRELSRLARQHKLGFVNLNIAQDYAPLLQKFFTGPKHGQVGV